MISINPQMSFNLEKGVKFLIENYSCSGHNEKPVILHSLRVAIYLLELGYNEELIMAALLHDLLEDTAVTITQIEQIFGSIVAEIVGAVSFDPRITDPREIYQEMFARIISSGRNALLLKGADLYSNSFYYQLAKTQLKFDLLIEKVKYFLDLSKSEIGGEAVWQDLNEQYNKLKDYQLN